MIRINVNNQDLQVEEGQNLLNALVSAGVRVPAVCFHPALKKITGICRMCTVEITLPGKTAEAHRACLTKTVEGLAVRTESVAVQAAREKALRAL